MTACIPLGTHVRYHGAEYVIRNYNDPAEHRDARIRGNPELIAAEYPDGTGYELWPAGISYKFGNRDYATCWVRRRSFEILENQEQPP